jgi:L-alanine-DL-glutamate epimerase-like enolase superfamily enzyme
VPLADLFGRARASAPVYGSGGFVTYDEPTARDQLEHWVGDLAIPRVKIKIGEARGADVRRDLARVAFARRTIGDDVELFVDANGAYRRKQAVRVGRMLADSGVTWFEEPVSSDDLDGLHLLRQRLDSDVAAGEYGYDLAYFGRMVAAGAVDCLQLDVTRCGGYSEWLRAAALAAAHGLEVSAHCAPSLHLPVSLAVENLRRIEYFHDHVRIETMLFDGVERPLGGTLSRSHSAPGHGLILKKPDAEGFRVA